jgi:hypothetical protein
MISGASKMSRVFRRDLYANDPVSKMGSYLIYYNLRSWLRHYATSRKVACSIPDVIVFFS